MPPRVKSLANDPLKPSPAPTINAVLYFVVSINSLHFSVTANLSPRAALNRATPATGILILKNKRSSGRREKSCMEGENRTREKLVADWSTFPAAERTRCIKSIEWFSPTYTELIACLEMHGQVRKLRENPAS